MRRGVLIIVTIILESLQTSKWEEFLKNFVADDISVRNVFSKIETFF
jgi:hypothetical protein